MFSFFSEYGSELRKEEMRKKVREVRRNFDVSM